MERCSRQTIARATRCKRVATAGKAMPFVHVLPRRSLLPAESTHSCQHHIASLKGSYGAIRQQTQPYPSTTYFQQFSYISLLSITCWSVRNSGQGSMISMLPVGVRQCSDLYEQPSYHCDRRMEAVAPCAVSTGTAVETINSVLFDVATCSVDAALMPT